MLAQVVGLLRCPHCRADLGLGDSGRAVSCPNRHSFDTARQGYLNLLPGDAGTGTGDNAAMVAARGTFSGPATTTRSWMPLRPPPCPASTGAVSSWRRTGTHLARVLDAAPHRTGPALDRSVHAARRAARAHPGWGQWCATPGPRCRCARAWQPVVLSVFAPRNGPEIARVLQPGGALVVVTPTAAHLAELVRTLSGSISVDERKQQRLSDQLDPYLSAESAHSVARVMPLGHRGHRGPRRHGAQRPPR